MRKININISVTTIILIVVVIVAIAGFTYLINRNSSLNTELQQERNLITALNDSLRTSINELGEVVSEKRTLQTTISRLEELNDQLTEDQKNLLRRLQASEREKNIFAAALIRSNIIIDSLVHIGEVLIGEGNVTFIADTTDIMYEIKVDNVMPTDLDVTPELIFNKLYLPNDMFVRFFWEDNKREGYPVAFSVSNSNRFMQVHNVESYAIPSIQKEVLDPNTWQKITQWLGDNRTTSFVIGGAVGFGVGWFVFK